MSETAEEQEGGGVGFVAEEEAMRKRHKKETGVSISFSFNIRLEKQN